MRPYLFLPFFLLLLAPAQAAPPPELGERMAPHELGSGGLLFRTDDGHRLAPTLSTDVEITVTGMIARTRVTQRFVNPTPDWVEGVYVFPLPEDSAVDALEMRVGDRVIKGRVEERARAKATYEKARSEGRKASLVEQERPNLFTTSIANLGPDERVEVILTYQEEIDYDAGRFGLRFPMVVGPRFVPGTREVAGFAGTGWGTNTDEVPDAKRITPPVAPPDAHVRNPVTLAVRLDAGFALVDIESSSHPIRVRAQADDTYHVRLEAETVPANADFVLSWRPTVGDAPGAALFREVWQGEHYALLMVLPPEPGAEPDATSLPPRVSRETIIVIDTSGSMGGESIVQARRAVDHALGTLRAQDAFNVIRFDSTVRPLFPSARPASNEALAEARRFVDGLDANGGTNMLPAIEAALRPGQESRAVRQVIFVTDGAVGNESALFAAIEQNLDRSRLYTVGIGSAPNAHFMSKAAEFGRGTFTYIGRPDEVAEKMSALFAKLKRPVLHDLALDWNLEGVETWPARIPDIYAGEPVIIAARLPNPTASVVLRGRRGPEAVRMALALEGGSNHPGVARLWARRKVAALMDSLHEGGDLDRVSAEVAGLGVRHQLVTRWSSLVAVDVTPTAPVGVEPDTRAVPSLLPRGWDFSKLFGRRDRQGPSSGPAARPAPLPDATRAATAAVAQPLAQVSVGRLPQGATPAALLVALGSSLLGVAGILFRGRRPGHDAR